MTKLGDVCTKIGSGATPRGGKEAYKPAGTPIIRSQNILDWSFSEDGLAFIDDSQAAALANAEVRPNDVLLNITGDSVARACMVPPSRTPSRVNQHVSILRTGEKLDPMYLLCFIQSQKAHLLKLASSGATRNALTKGMLEALEIELPALSQQQAIAGVVNAIQSKIALNNQINGYLAEIIQSRFDSLEQTTGWTSARADELFEVGIGKTPPRKEPEWFAKNSVGNYVWLSIKDMGEPGVYSFDSSEYLTPQAVKDKNVRKVPKGSVLLSFKLTVGRVKIAAVDMTTNEAIACFASDDPARLAYLYPFLRAFDYNKLGSTSSIATAVNSKTVKAMIIDMPDTDTLAKFYTSTVSLYDELLNNARENIALKSLRDSLLPKLMSGEIDVSKVDLTQLNSHLSD